jgi:hypothetical protein
MNLPGRATRVLSHGDGWLTLRIAPYREGAIVRIGVFDRDGWEVREAQWQQGVTNGSLADVLESLGVEAGRAASLAAEVVEQAPARVPPYEREHDAEIRRRLPGTLAAFAVGIAAVAAWVVYVLVVLLG